jgi:hypothetical protein
VFFSIHGTTIHELAHNAHYEHFYTRDTWLPRAAEFSKMSTRLKENWARGVQYNLTRKMYNEFVNDYFTDYGGIIEDLMDNNASTADGKSTESVSGFSIVQLEDCVLRSVDLTEMKGCLKQRYPSRTDREQGRGRSLAGIRYTEQAMDDLFDYWINLK